MIRLEKIQKSYTLGSNTFPILNKLDLNIHCGEFVALTGVSGSGKSTLMNILGCLDQPTGGSYFLNGRDVSQLTEMELARERNVSIGFVFQNFNLLPRMSALMNVTQPLIYRGVSPAIRKEAAAHVLRRVGLGDRMDNKPNELSGGQRQRVAIARALIGQPKIVLADEPTGNLDSKTTAEIMNLFHELHQEGLTLIIVTHESEIAESCARVIRLSDGEIVEDRPGYKLLKKVECM